MYQNKDLIPIPSPYFATDGKQGTVVKVDDYTVRYQFSDPYYALPVVMAGQGPIMGHTKEGRTGMGGYAPAHYLQQFHPKYVSKEDLDKKVKEAKFDNWVSLLKFKNDWARNPELPVLAPWKTTSPITTPTWTLERNPYSIWVDTEGNQLPYIGEHSSAALQRCGGPLTGQQPATNVLLAAVDPPVVSTGQGAYIR